MSDEIQEVSEPVETPVEVVEPVNVAQSRREGDPFSDPAESGEVAPPKDIESLD